MDGGILSKITIRLCSVECAEVVVRALSTARLTWTIASGHVGLGLSAVNFHVIETDMQDNFRGQMSSSPGRLHISSDGSDTSAQLWWEMVRSLYQTNLFEKDYDNRRGWGVPLPQNFATCMGRNRLLYSTVPESLNKTKSERLGSFRKVYIRV